ncbi:hypothetical protein [Streptomyces sp. NPDC020298]|uniref:hypothetical protein n=1 Tax=unclassified Streptomyces TaxID=2593676 RepID=UPI0033C3D938
MSRSRANVPHSSELRMVIRRADGTMHDHGVVDAHYRNPFRQAWWLYVRRPLANRRIRRSNRTAGRG